MHHGTSHHPDPQSIPEDGLDSNISENSAFDPECEKGACNLIGGSQIVRDAGDSVIVEECPQCAAYYKAMDIAEKKKRGELPEDEVVPDYDPKHDRNAHVIAFDADDEDLPDIADYTRDNTYDNTQPAFNFSLPFGNTNSVPKFPLAVFKSSNPEKTQMKKELNQKLKRTESISSVEEMEYFRDEKGLENARSKALRKSLELDTLRQSIRKATAPSDTKTHDGYLLTRLDSIWSELEGDMVIMGGYRGSILRSTATKKMVWIPIKAGLNIKKVDLLMGPEEEAQTEAEKILYSDAMLTSVGPVDIAKKLIRKLDANPNVHIEEFGYDWRLSLEISAEKLAKKLQENYDKQEVKKGTYILAHSMGGLVAHRVLQKYTKLVRGIIYIGSPSQCPNVLGPIRFGDELLLNKTILSKEANFFMRSSFYFMPLDGRCFVNRNTGKRIDLDYFDVETWKEYGLSPLVNTEYNKPIEAKKEEEERAKEEKEKESANADSEKATMHKTSTASKITGGLKLKHTWKNTTKFVKGLTGNGKPKTPAWVEDPDMDDDFQTSYEESCVYLDRTLKEAKAFSESLQYDPTKDYPPLVILYGNRVPTVRGAKVDCLDCIKEGHYNDYYYGPGDGVVHHKWLLPETKGFPVAAKIASTAGHVSLMTDIKSVSKAWVSLIDGEKERDERRAKEGITATA